MARIYENDKGFKVIRTDNMSEVLKLGGVAMCDSCNQFNRIGYYIAVLNSWYCDKCFNEWYEQATYYKEDAHIERACFDNAMKLLSDFIK